MILSMVSANRVKPGKVVYLVNDLSFDTLDRQESGIYSVLINDINIDFSENFEANAIWGFSPSTAWRQGHVETPQGCFGRLQMHVGQCPGVATRITASDQPWPVTFDKLSGWLYIGLEKTESDAKVEFLSGCVVGLSSSTVCGLWLHPEFLSDVAF